MLGLLIGSSALFTTLTELGYLLVDVDLAAYSYLRWWRCLFFIRFGFYKKNN